MTIRPPLLELNNKPPPFVADEQLKKLVSLIRAWRLFWLSVTGVAENEKKAELEIHALGGVEWLMDTVY